MTSSLKPIAVACGDPSGIGPEISAGAVRAALEEHPHRSFVLIGDARQLAQSGWAAGVDPRVENRVAVLDPRPEALPAGLEAGGRTAAIAGLDYLRRGAEGCVAGEFDGLVTAPVSKEAILRTGTAFVGQTEFLAELTRTPDVTMMLLGDDAQGRWLRVALVTTHLPLQAVANAIRTPGVERAIRQSHEACRDLGLTRARIAVCGLNPHAGEGGMLGGEEKAIIEPAIANARRAGIDVHGPTGADTIFHQAFRGDFDVVVAMYHDQGLGPLKLAVFERGVNWTLGLPFPRTSPDHGTAFDIAGKGIADSTSMQAAIRLAVRLADRRRDGIRA